MRTTTAAWICPAAMALLLCAMARAEDVKVLCDFEDDAGLKVWEFPKGSPSLSDQHVTSGKKSLKLAIEGYMVSFSLPRDWSGYESLNIDAFVEGDDPVNGTVLVADKPWQDAGRQYWDRHNGSFNLKPGANVVSLPVNGLYRGEAGSRGANLKTNIDPKQILRFDLGFSTPGKSTAVYLDNMRLVKESRPDGILAFDFGPESQTVFPGFTPISWNTVYGKGGNKAGLKRAGWGSSLARDDTFPTRLYQDFVEMGTDPDSREFIADMPNGKCHVWVVFDDCGYWGGETCHHRKRSISANGRQAWADERGDDGPTDYLFRFEKTEPKPGDSMWDLYMKDLFKPARFETEVTDGKLALKFEADAGWSSKVAAIVAYPDSVKAEAEKWVAQIEDRNRKEFESRAAFMGPKPKALEVPADAKGKGFWLGFPALEEDVAFVDAPGRPDGKLQRAAARGQRVAFTFAVRPLKDLGEAKIAATDLKGAGGAIPAAKVDLRYVHHSTHRGFNDIAYTIGPEGLRKVDGSGLKLAKDLTRQFWITVEVPGDSKGGTYSGEVMLSAGDLGLKIPLSLDVVDAALDEPDFPFGFFGNWVPGELPDARQKKAWTDLFALLRKCGMSTVSGGPNIRFSGLDEAGKPKLDFKACDDYFRALKAAGFSKPVYAYGGPAMIEGLYDGYSIGNTGREWEKKTGKPFKELLGIVWTAVKEHADKEGWLPVNVGMLDEPRALDPAKEHLEFHKAFREGAPFVRTGGYYSVDWEHNDPLAKTVQEIFKTMVWSGLNLHRQVDLDKAKEFGREIHIYNQANTRFGFGAYQWAEMRKGVKGRVQWHMLALHGFQFFDLDGREPDTAMINWGRSEVIPTIRLARCAEGAWDFRLAATLWNLAEKKKGSAEAKAAQDFLEDVSRKIGVGQNEPPKDYMGDEAFRNACVEHMRKLAK